MLQDAQKKVQACKAIHSLDVYLANINTDYIQNGFPQLSELLYLLSVTILSFDLLYISMRLYSMYVITEACLEVG